MNILFVRNYPSVDGVFTLLIRLAKKFKKDGHIVYFIDFGVTSDFQSEISETFILLTVAEIESKCKTLNFDIIFPFAGGDLLFWCINILKRKFFKNAKMVFGIYHPRAYFTSTLFGTSPDKLLHKYILSRIPSQNILFMNEVVKSENEKYFKIIFENSPIVPIPVILANKVRDVKSINRRKIVSIGRLETFKWYIIPMIDVIEDLNSKGFKFEFFIYGHGGLDEFLKRYITQKNVGSYVFLMGKLDYKDLSNVLKDAFMFVGMGTAIIEASAIGVPSLQAIDNERRQVTYGFFDKLNGYSLGEKISELPLVDMEYSIIELGLMNDSQYQQVCERHIVRANVFDIDEVIKAYYKFFGGASSVLDFKISNFILITTKLLRQIFKIRKSKE